MHQNRRRRSIHGCGHHRLQPHRRCRHVVHIIVKIKVISIFFFSFNGVDLLCSMSTDCCCLSARSEAPWRPWEGGGRHGWHVCVFHLALASFNLGTSCVRCPPTHYPTNNPLPSQLNISINNRGMRTFYAAILCACIVGRRLCSMAALFYYLGVGGSR